MENGNVPALVSVIIMLIFTDMFLLDSVENPVVGSGLSLLIFFGAYMALNWIVDLYMALLPHHNPKTQ